MNVDLAIRLGDREARYAAGDPIEGFVEVVCREACRCRALVLRREWRVEGGGFCDSEVLDEVVLHRGQWAAGEVRSYPFEVGPTSVRGDPRARPDRLHGGLHASQIRGLAGVV